MSTRRSIAAARHRKRGQPGEKARTGRPPLTFDRHARDLVEALVGYGLTHRQVATLVRDARTGRPISERSLRAHFPVELKRGGARVHAVAVQRMHQIIARGKESVAARLIEFHLKTRCGWKETNALEVTGRDGAPLTQPMDDEQRAARIAALLGRAQRRQAVKEQACD
jgi:hypothetical protein